ncbi:MAG TPA: DUF3276 family protein [Bacteroidales bacterium]
MEEKNQRNPALEKPKNYEFFSEAVRAGRRTYFFDARVTQDNDFYITISESKQVINPDGQRFYEKHKIFLYPEDFDQFSKGLEHIINSIRSIRHTSPSRRIILRKPTKIEPGEKIEARDTFHEFDNHVTVEDGYKSLDENFEDLGTSK